MFKTKLTTTDSRIKPITIQGMSGRVLKVKAMDKRFEKRNILLIYGHHASLERYITVAEAMSDFGTVTLVDLPGFGGMDSFRKIGKVPKLDNFAEYMAVVVKELFGSERVLIAGVSYGLAIASRMLQLHPELCSQTESVVSIVGFPHHRDFKLSKTALRFYLFASSINRNYWLNLIVRTLVTNDLSIGLAYGRYGNARAKFAGKTKDEKRQIIRDEITLWQINDFWTYAWVAYDTVTLDLLSEPIPVPLLHVLVSGDQYFDSTRIKQDLKRLYPDSKFFNTDMDNHAPTSFENTEEVKALIPSGLRKELTKIYEK